MKTSSKVLFWLPRIICILAILFVSMFAFDAFEPGLSIWQQAGGFIIHLIPSFILLAFLLFAWKRELAGGILFVITGLVLSPMIYIHNYRMNHSVLLSLEVILLITFPFVVVGVLFILDYFLRKRQLKHTGN